MFERSTFERKTANRCPVSVPSALYTPYFQAVSIRAWMLSAGVVWPNAQPGPRMNSPPGASTSRAWRAASSTSDGRPGGPDQLGVDRSQESRLTTQCALRNLLVGLVVQLQDLRAGGHHLGQDARRVTADVEGNREIRSADARNHLPVVGMGEGPVEPRADDVHPHLAHGGAMRSGISKRHHIPSLHLDAEIEQARDAAPAARSAPGPR